MDVKMRVVGIKEIDNVLKGLSTQVNHKLLQSAHVQAAKILVEKAKLLAPEGPTGNTIDSIGTVKIGFGKANELGLTQTGPRRRGGRYKGHIAHLIEYGTKPRQNAKGANRGVMPKRPFMEPAWEQTKDRVQGSINEFLGKALLTYMKRTLRG